MLNAISEVIGSGGCTADVDKDGFLDIYAVNGTGYTHFYGKKWWWFKTPYNTLYKNNGDGTFQDSTEEAGVGDTGHGMGCAFGDYDGDGYPDLYVTNYGANKLYRNKGDGTFSDVTEAAGVGNDGWSTSLAWGDYDNDGDLDLYVANYLVFDKTMNPGEGNSAFKINMPLLLNSKLFDGQKNVLYKNNGDGTFTDSGGSAGVDSPYSGMGVAAGDYDNDGDVDLFSTYNQSDTNILFNNRTIEQRGERNTYAKAFVDVTVTVDSGLGENVSVGYMGWGTEFADFNHDGFLDLFVANGHGMPDFDNPQTTIAQRNQIFLNKEGRYFSERPAYVDQSFVARGSTSVALVTILRSKEEAKEVRLAALNIVGKSKKKSMYFHVARIVHDTEDELQGHAIDALFRLGGTKIVALLQELITNKRNSLDVRVEAVSTLGHMQDKKAIKALKALL